MAGGGGHRAVADVVVLQLAVDTYRRPFFEDVADACARSGRSLRVLSGLSNHDASHVTRVVDAPVEAADRNRFLLGRRLVVQRRVWRTAVSADVLVVETNPRNLTSVGALVYRHLRRRPTAVWGHAHPRRSAAVAGRLARRAMQRLATVVMTYTPDEAAQLGRSLPTARIVVVPNALTRSADMHAVDGEPSSPVYVGRLSAAKKPALLVDAFRMARSVRPDMGPLQIVGDGPETADLVRLVHEFDLDDHVVFHGWVEDEEVLRLIHRDAFCAVSPGYVGLSAMQAVGRGLPLLYAREEPHAPEVAVLDETNSVPFTADSAVALAAAMTRTYDDRQAWRHRRDDLRNSLAARYTIDSMVAGFMAGVDTALGAGGPSILVSDYAGHPFTFDLAADLAANRRTAAYTYCSSSLSPKASMAAEALDVRAISTGDDFEKYDLRRRLISELKYGIGLTRAVVSIRPRVHVVCNMPLVSLAIVRLATRPLGVPTVVWYQDVQSGLAAGIVGKGMVVDMLSRLETTLLRTADRVIANSPELASDARERGVDPGMISMLQNWAPVEEFRVRPRANPWAQIHDLHDVEGPVFLYSGTLARKHDPSLLLDLADAVHGVGGVVVIVSEGEGVDWIRAHIDHRQAEHVRILPFQRFEDLPDVLATADVLVALLERSASPFSVPSKILSYLCAARPVLAAMPVENSAARLLETTGSGIVVSPDDPDALREKAMQLALDPELRRRMGEAGRRHAVANFRRDVIRERFLTALAGASAGRSTDPVSPDEYDPVPDGRRWSA